jgi:hypothetical protein
MLFNGDLTETLQWLNRSPTRKDTESVRKALRRQIFKYPTIHGEPNYLAKNDAIL